MANGPNMRNFCVQRRKGTTRECNRKYPRGFQIESNVISMWPYAFMAHEKLQRKDEIVEFVV
jgi:hypothetical protein